MVKKSGGTPAWSFRASSLSYPYGNQRISTGHMSRLSAKNGSSGVLTLPGIAGSGKNGTRVLEQSGGGYCGTDTPGCRFSET